VFVIAAKLLPVDRRTPLRDGGPERDFPLSPQKGPRFLVVSFCYCYSYGRLRSGRGEGGDLLNNQSMKEFAPPFLATVHMRVRMAMGGKVTVSSGPTGASGSMGRTYLSPSSVVSTV
jgi:hypothetical protein